MEEEILKNIATQLRQPQGEFAVQVGERMNKGNLHINLFTLDALNLNGEENILEIGMGNGFFVKNLLNKYPKIKYSGCDYSEIMVGESKRNNNEFIENGRADFICGQADKLPFEDAGFDKIFTINTLYFWEDTTAVFNELKRVLKPSGQIIIAVRPKKVMEKYPFVKYGFKMYDRDTLISLVTDNNFSIIDVLESEEPTQEINNIQMPVSTLLVSAELKRV